MNTAPIKVDDIVECDVRGRRFYALVEAREPRTSGTTSSFRVRPITHNINFRTVTAHQIVSHFRRAGRRP